ncbi:MAG TPA: hypothetical protein VI306_04550 [Pyrinomonadaceae bacterium]
MAKISESLGSIILGTGVGVFVSMIQTSEYTPTGTILTVVCFAIGLPAIFLHAVKD